VTVLDAFDPGLDLAGATLQVESNCIQHFRNARDFPERFELPVAVQPAAKPAGRMPAFGVVRMAVYPEVRT